MPRLPRPRSRLLLAILLPLVALELAWLAGGNLFLNTGWGQGVVNRRPEKLLTTWRWGFTPFPELVFLSGFRIRAQSRSVQWAASAEGIWGRVSLLPLAQRTFRAEGVRGEGVVFRLRRRADRSPRARALAALQPPIGGLENPPRPAPEDLYPPRPPGKRWTVALRSTTLSGIEEIWIDQYRFRGRAEAAGGFRVRIKEETRIFPTSLALDAGTLVVGEKVLASPVAGRLELRSRTFAHPRVKGRAALAHFDGRLRVEGELVALAPLAPSLPWRQWVETAGGGPLQADIGLAAGSLTEASHVRFRSSRLSLALLDYEATGEGALIWRAGSASPGGDESGENRKDRWELTATLDRYRLRRRDAETSHVRGEGLVLRLLGDSLELGRKLRPARLTVLMPPAAVPDFRVYDAYLPRAAGFRVLGGRGEVSARLAAELGALSGSGPRSGSGSGAVHLVGHGLRLGYRDLVLNAELDLEAELPRLDVAARRFDLTGTRLRLEGGEMSAPGSTAPRGEEPWWLRALIEEGTLTPGRPVILDARLELALRDSRPLLALIETRRDLPGWLERALYVEGVGATGRLETGQGYVELAPFALAGEDLEVRGRIRFAQPRRQGVIYVRHGRFDLGIELTPEGSDLKVLRPRKWFERMTSE